MRRPTGAMIWAAIADLPAGQPFTAKTIALSTGLPANLISAMLRRYTDHGQLEVIGLVGQQARGGLRASLYRVVPP